ncbi:MAG: glycosyltransferase family 2 protein [Candidatus Binatia bacterium]|nr:glycosyltransferase family 2 protein [Candidatus Binatia bacterium]
MDEDQIQQPAPEARPLLSVVIPIFNEVGTLREIVDAVRAIGIEHELVLVDDASSDGTHELLEVMADEPNTRVFYQSPNQGKGAALRRGFAEATGQIVVVQDADLEYDPAEYPKLIGPIIAGKADVVFGSRFVGSDAHRVLYFWHSVVNRSLTMLSNIFTNLNLTDMETCYKVFRREVLESFTLEENRFGIEPEVTAKVAKGNWRVYEVGISYSGRTYDEGKKIGWKDGVRALFCILKYNLFR